ncbi:preprotein translocase subunit SecG [Parasaccharibacter sp. TMW2.1882]|uniref:Protein-export membrane protein SecG n=1 Tax=Parasaccharibacter apium TaxID=1510841 RepID=A0A7U7G6C1_9PROT|nr:MULTISPECIES: preprotein translocase subunit SecG [Acetobacteraceae]MCL1561899.1 preprotein translocase subunit SecG [Parasaccharibacter sp. TMW 2.1886]MCQ0041972.1 preprotein translocase subunit SecG [Bombella sp.]MUG79327.1 preprotein translocase subunit SecG [Bombella sp. ESL0380]MUH02634.1 preprotein translocase subunit SecG [Bombella sp. ESL0387]QGT74996.1 preprotein translocase subunit SecG [Bombella sp. ESL0368]
MTTLLLILTVLVALALIGIILIQRSEGGGLGVGSSQGLGSFMSGRGTATLLTRGTAVLAAIFMILCLCLAVLNRGASSGGNTRDILAHPPASQPAAPAAPTAPSQPQHP